MSLASRLNAFTYYTFQFVKKKKTPRLLQMWTKAFYFPESTENFHFLMLTKKKKISKFLFNSHCLALKSYFLFHELHLFSLKHLFWSPQALVWTNCFFDMVQKPSFECLLSLLKAHPPFFVIVYCGLLGYYFHLKIICLFLERGEGREKERERNINVCLPLTCSLLGTWPTTKACALTGNQTSDHLVLRLALNPLSHTSQGCCGLLVTIFLWKQYKKENLCVLALSKIYLLTSCLIVLWIGRE